MRLNLFIIKIYPLQRFDSFSVMTLFTLRWADTGDSPLNPLVSITETGGGGSPDEDVEG